MTKAKTPRTNCGNCGNGAPALATNSCTNTLTMKAVKRAPKTANSSPRCSRMPTSASSIACCSGRSIASPAKAWVPTIMHLQRLASYGVGFHSYTEPHLATDNELVSNILLALLASLAKVEAQKISERTRAGMARARAQGKRIGRPAISRKLREQIAGRIAAGETPYAVAKALGIDRHTAAKYA